jgi:hypothetical protein
LTIHTRYGDVDEQLNGVEAKLGIDQGWAADLEEDGTSRIDVVGHREALAQTLCNRVEDIDDADCSGPSRRTDFSCSTGNSTNNSEATVRQHTLRAKALGNIDLVDRNYTLENDLRDTQGRMLALLAQNAFLQGQLTTPSRFDGEALASSQDGVAMRDESPIAIRGGGGDLFHNGRSRGRSPIPRNRFVSPIGLTGRRAAAAKGEVLDVSTCGAVPRSWGCKFITKLHNMVHKQWIYRNSMIHFRSTDGLTIPEHHEILNQMESYSLVDPETLLPRHQTLLDADFESLGSGPTSHRLLWLANMSLAMSAAHLARSGTLSDSALAHFFHVSPMTQPE